MMNSHINIDSVTDEFGWLNSFYGRKDARSIIYSLFRGRCASTNARVDLANSDVGHIVPQSETAYFESLFPGLNVHNLINLHLLDASENRRVSNHFPRNPLMIYNAISYNIRLIRQRLPAILSQQAGPKGLLDPQTELERIQIRVDVDYSDLYDDAVCFGDYHSLDAGRAQDKFRSIVAAHKFPENDVANFHEFGLKNNVHVFVHVDEGRVTGLSGKFTSPKNPDWSDNLYKHYLKCRLENASVDLPDGEYVFMGGPVLAADKRYSLTLNLHSRRSIVEAIEMLASSQTEPTPLGKLDSRPLVFVPNDFAIRQLCHSQTHRRVLFGNATEQILFPYKFWLMGYGGTAPEYEDFAKQNTFENQEGSGCVMLKSDYNTLLRQTRKAVASDLERLSVDCSPSICRRTFAPASLVLR